jgi:hypothetical protein
MDRIVREAKKYLEKSGGTSKKGSRGKTSSSDKRGSSEKRGGGSVADKAKRAAREFFK